MASTAVIITALPVEFKAVRSFLTNIVEEEDKEGGVYERGVFLSKNNKEWSVGIAETGPGNENAASLSQMAIKHFKPDVIFFVGVAGGIKDVKIGDVVAADKVYGYEYGAAENEFKPRPNVGESTFRLIHRARAEARKDDWIDRIGDCKLGNKPKAFVGPIAAGEKVIKSTTSDTFEIIKKNYGDALAVEMEGRGFLKAAHAHALNAIVIRGISDLIDKKEEADLSGSQDIASRNAAAFAFEILSKIRIEPEKEFSSLTQSGTGEPSDQSCTDCGNLSNEPIKDLSDHGLTSLMIRLKPSDKFDNHYDVDAWLVGLDNKPTVSDRNLYSRTHSQDELEGVLFKLTKEVAGTYKIPRTKLWIEFFLPLAMLSNEVDQIKTNTGPYGKISIGFEYRVVVRPYERIEWEYPFLNLNIRWRELMNNCKSCKVKDSVEDECHTHFAYWCRPNGKNPGYTYTNFEKNEKLLCVIFEAEPDTNDQSVNPFRCLLDHGVPVALWIRGRHNIKPRVIKSILCNAVERDDFRFLPDRIMCIRRNSFNEIDSSQIMNRVTLMWDDPTRVPPDMEPLTSPLH